MSVYHAGRIKRTRRTKARAIAANCIKNHVDQEQLEILRAVEQEEREGLCA